MDQLEITSPIVPQTSSSDAESLAEEVRLLRKYLLITLAATVVVAFCFNAFLYRVDRSTRGQLAQVKQVRAELEQKVGTTLGAFLKQVVDYAGTNPDAAKILNKYGIRLPASNGPAVTPIPANTPKAVAPAGGAKK